MKKTFTNFNREKFQEAIQKFKRISEGTDCVVRSGYCTSHNAKMVRNVRMKKMSNVDGKFDIYNDYSDIWACYNCNRWETDERCQICNKEALELYERENQFEKIIIL